MKNGFTLIELLGVIILLSILVLLAYPALQGLLKKQTYEVDNTTRQMIYKASDLYISDNSHSFKKINGRNKCIALTTLVDEGLLKYPVKLFSNKTDISDIKTVSVLYNDGFKYSLVDNEDCIDNTKAYMVSLPDGKYFKENDYLTKIKTVNFVDYIDTEGSLKTYDLTDKELSPNKSIIAWIDSDYNLFIGSVSDIYTKDLSYAFNGMSSVTDFNFDNLNTSENKNLKLTFSHMTNLVSLNLSNFDTSSTQNMADAFSYNTNLLNINLNGLDTSNVTDMRRMFKFCSSLETIDLSPLNTKKVTQIQQMFENCSSLKELDLSTFDTSSAQNMTYMFSDCEKLEELNISSFNTSKVNDMQYMFNECHSLSSLDVTNFNTTKVKSMTGMFKGLRKISSLDLSSFDTTALAVVDLMFSSDYSLTNLNLSKAKFSSVTSYIGMFNGVPNNISIISNSDGASFLRDRLGQDVGTITY
ncbi:MAG: BspA family leucine-rich repeat surface protein [bacterium]|nr:BspA family leucine-rich repeat surface protein [bacterium]